MSTNERITEAELPLGSEEFTDRLVAEIDAYIDEHGLADARLSEQRTDAEMRNGLYTRIYNEVAVLDLAREMLDDLDGADDPQAFVHLLKQIEDEAKHARMLSQRLWNLGGAPEESFERASEETEAFWDLLSGLDAVETNVMLQAGVERMAQYRHPKELEFYDEETAEVYEKVIVPEEQFHAKVGVRLLETLCTDEGTQRRALEQSREGRETIREVHDEGVRNAYSE
jgi:rubrerythrin